MHPCHHSRAQSCIDDEHHVLPTQPRKHGDRCISRLFSMESSYQHGFRCSNKIDDPSKFSGIQACPANKASINVRFFHQPVDGVRPDTASVKDSGFLCNLLTIHLSQHSSADRMHFLSNLRSCYFPSSNGPHFTESQGSKFLATCLRIHVVSNDVGRRPNKRTRFICNCNLFHVFL